MFQTMSMRMRLLLLHANGAFFLTSDCPVRVHNRVRAAAATHGFQAFEMLFPLKRKYCLAGVYSAGLDRIELESDQVHDVNRSLVVRQTVLSILRSTPITFRTNCKNLNLARKPCDATM